ncbi:TetR/AcrR family transcriptional regulator [Paeniglutamicibacter cryotolerans]|uniref:AcrR family transcriptional regulator n=1 Tax=Paeniglutamicibacter cryotolerans TaxID=670079 RepID=A0A839QQ16_9MICC|nr:TetR/AcrR family transcriptional regulator [Paeniglutamicibacter cryotolerans]MBB2996844.1 AcrR family transcriptional regulator [Paeniglutamicibacter cryotolerans]
MTDSGLGRKRLSRGALTGSSIALATLRLLDEKGTAGFTLPALGRALGADQTAVYRHYAHKDDIVLAVADLLLEEVLDGYHPAPCWRAAIADLSRRIREVYKRHPAAGSLSGSRTTGRTGEKQLVEAFLAAIIDAGFEGQEAALYYRVAADFSLFWAGGHAGYLALDPDRQFTDESSWTREYFNADPQLHPRTAQTKQHLAEVGFDEIFETALALMLDGIEVRAPKPCTCTSTDHPTIRPRHSRA